VSNSCTGKWDCPAIIHKEGCDALRGDFKHPELPPEYDDIWTPEPPEDDGKCPF
jgi:hypothetical protein